MVKHIIYRWHRDDGTGVISITDKQSPVKVIELGQRNMRAQGFNDGITWKVYEGDFINAMVATKTL